MDKVFKPEALKSDLLERKRIFQVVISEKDVTEWCILLCQLKFSVIQSVRIEGKTASFRLSLEVSQKKKRRTKYARLRNGEVNLTIAEKELDGWLKFYLAQIENGKQDGEHMDVQIYDVGENPDFDRFYLTLS